MAIDEKYLDDLLKSITENEDEPRTMDDAMREMASLSEAEVDGANENWANDLDDFFSQPQDLGYEDSVALDDFAEEVLPEMTPDLEENVNLEEMELLKEIAEAGFDYEHASLDSPSEDNGTDDETEDEVDADVDSLGVGNDDLDEINGLLSNVDESASVDEDILALLEGMEGSEEIEDAEDPFNLFDEEILEAVKEQEPFNDQVQIQEEEPEPETAGILEGIRFLAAEDNEINAEILSELLEIEGASCEVVGNGRLAVERFREAGQDEFDAILMDVQMPVMNGHEAARAIRALPRSDAGTIPIIAMTANAFAEDEKAALDAGMDAHVAKPLDVEMLKKVIRKCVRRKESL